MNRERFRNRDPEEPVQLEGRIEPTEETKQEIDRLIEQQRQFQDDLRLAAVVLGFDWLLFD